MAKIAATKSSTLPFLVKKAKADAQKKHQRNSPPLWEALHQDAITETDPDRMLKKIARAEPAIFKRLLRLRSNPSRNKDEVKALIEAAGLLCELKLILFRKMH